MARAQGLGMRAEKLEDLLIYVKAREGIDAVSPLLQRPKLIRDFDLHKQLSESTGKIPAILERVSVRVRIAISLIIW